MNKYQEALEKMYNNYVYGAKQKEDSYFILQELVDKATPKKPLEIYSNVLSGDAHTSGLCICKNKIYMTEEEWYELVIWRVERSEMYSFCQHCGQAIDWSQDDNPHR